ncbi:hypothetical protein [Streptomyces hydrogenans]|nr:hypothetical protein [Streptomyces hydrogenans]
MSDSVAAVAFTPPDLDRPSDLVERAPIQRLPAPCGAPADSCMMAA